MNSRASLSALLVTSLILPSFPAVAQHGGATDGDVVIDMSGRDGTDDKAGYSYSTSDDPGQYGDGSGKPGAAGGDAVSNPNKDGQAAGDIYITLSYAAPQKGQKIRAVEADVSVVKPGTNQQERFRDRHNLTSMLNYLLRAVGGRGGDGANGGRGQKGGDGQDGADAYHIGHMPVPGTNGKDGGRGGDAGAPTSGGHAAPGGKIKFRVSIKHTGLAMLLKEALVDGNRGGTAGRSLGPGAGGSGGSGGSSHSISWQEKVGTEPVYSSRTVTTTNSEGETVDAGTEEYVSGYRDVYETRSSYAPGGSSGSSGSSGNQSLVSAFDGRNSARGEFQYIVVEENGEESVYPAPYSLILQPNFKLRGDLNNNGFFEPGETVYVEGITVTNAGLAPTPAEQEVEIYLTDGSNWIRSHKTKLKLPLVLQPGESYTFPKEHLSFYLKEKPRKKPGALDSNDALKHHASVTLVRPDEREGIVGVDREFESFANGAGRGIKVRYPLRITPLKALDAMVPGDVSRVLFEVENISEQTIGKVEGMKLRMAHTQLRRDGGSTQADQAFVLSSPDAKFIESQIGVQWPLAGLKPGEKMIMEALVGLDKDARPYTDVTWMPELHLESNLEKGQVNRVQFEPFTLRVSQTFKYNDEADILLVANTSLNENVLEALRYSAETRNLSMDIWDFSLYGFFSMRHESMFKAYRNKTIIILGNDIKTPAGNERAQNLLSPDEVIEAGRRYGIRFVIVDTSEDAKATVERMIAPETVSGESLGLTEYTSVDSYVKELKSEVKKLDEQVNGDVAEDVGISEITLTASTLFGKPNAQSAVDKLTANALKSARGVAPEVSLYIDQTVNLEKTGGGLWKKWNLGKLRIRRSVDVSRTSVMAVQIPLQSLKDPRYIMSDEFQAIFDKGIHVETKLKLIGQILSGTFKLKDMPPEYRHLQIRSALEFATLLLKGVLNEIIDEQMAIRPFDYVSKVDKATLWNKLDVLNQVANHPYGQTELDMNSPEGKMWLEFVSELTYFSTDSVTKGQRFWSVTFGRLFGKSKNYQVSEVTNELISRLVEGVFMDSQRKEIQTAIEARVEELRKANNRQRGQYAANGLSIVNLQNIIIRNGTVEPQNRVRTPEIQAEMQAAAAARVARAAAVRKAYVDQASEMKLKQADCEEIIKRRAATAQPAAKVK